MRVLAVCPLPRLAGTLLYFERAMRSIYAQDFPHQIDYFMQNGDFIAGHRFDRVTYKYETARQLALAQGYDAMWCIEYDMLVPPDALSRLAKVEADIAYSLYCWRWQPYLWSAYLELGDLVGVSLSQYPERARELWGQVIDVAGVGQGCTLIRRNVLERITFRRAGNASCDWYMALDAQRLGLSQKCDTGLVCGHMSMTPRPFVVWPDPESMVRYDEII